MWHKIKRFLFVVSIISFVWLSILIYNKKDDRFGFTKNKLLWSSESGWWEIHADTFIEYYWNKLITWNFEDRKDLVKKYCNFLFSWQDNKVKNWFVKWPNKYEPKKSVFLYGLCTHVDKNNEEHFSEIKPYLKWDYKLESESTQQNSDDSKPCDAESDMNACNFSNVLGKLYKDTINDYSNIKLASMFWYESDDPEKDIEKFSKLYFSSKECEDAGFYYLYKENIEDEKKNYCSHPKTFKLMKEYIENMKSKLENLKLLDSNAIKEGYFYENLLKRWPYDFKWYKKLMYNELMFYNLFMNYYVYALSVDNGLHPIEIWWDYSQLMESKDSEQMLSSYEIGLSQQAAYQSERLLANIYSDFPVHIWFMSYYEDVLNFRKKFAKVFTPFHQMYYKMQNVQDMRK